MTALQEAIASGRIKLNEVRKAEAAKKQAEIASREGVLNRRWERVLAGLQTLLGPLEKFLESLPRSQTFEAYSQRTEIALQFPECAPIYVTMAQQADDTKPWQALQIYGRVNARFQVPELQEPLPCASGVPWYANIWRTSSPGCFYTNFLDEALADASDKHQKMEALIQAQVTPPQPEPPAVAVSEPPLPEQLVNILRQLLEEGRGKRGRKSEVKS